MRGLLRVVLGAAQIDQVEIDIGYDGPAQIGAAEICFADFLGRFEGLFIVVVGVEAGAAPFAGVGTKYQPAARRARVERTIPQIDARPLNLAQVRSS